MATVFDGEFLRIAIADIKLSVSVCCSTDPLSSLFPMLACVERVESSVKLRSMFYLKDAKLYDKLY